MKKIIIAAILLGSLAVFMGPAVFAADKETPVKLDGTVLSTAALVDGASAWLPFRAVCEALGYAVSWANDSGVITVSAVRDTDSVTVDVTHQKIVQNGHQLDAGVLSGGGVRLLSGRTYLDSGLFASIFPVGASYDSKTAQIMLRKIYVNNMTVVNETVASEEEFLITAVQYPRVTGLEDANIMSAINDVLKKTAQKAVDEGRQNADEMAQAIRDGYTGAVGRCETYMDYMVIYNENGLFSVVLSNYQYSGGAHGSTVQTAYTFDLATGKMLKLSDLMNEKSDYTACIDSAVRREIDSRVAAGALYEFEFSPFETIGDAPAFFLSDSGIVFYFQEYEYFPYAAGIQEFLVGYSDLLPMLKDAYRFLGGAPVVLLPYDPNILPVGDIGRVALDGNPTTGYTWHFAVANGDVLALVSDDYTPSVRPGIAGAGGTYVWNFKGIAPGSTTITFKYYRNWEGESSVTEDNTVVYDVTVMESKIKEASL